MAEEQPVTEEQRAYEEWRTEILDDPESRAIYEEESRKLRAWHYAEVAKEARTARKVVVPTSDQASAARAPVVMSDKKGRDR